MKIIKKIILKFNQNRLIAALRRFILFTALVHLSLVFFYSIKNLTIVKLNYFDIIDIDLFAPDAVQSIGSHVLSAAVIIILVVVFIIFHPKKTQ